MTATILQWTDGGITYDFDFDAVETEAPTHAVNITEYPIELGAPLIDFVRPQMLKLKLTAFITNTPTRVGLSHMDGYQPQTRLDVRVRTPGGEAVFRTMQVRVRVGKFTNPGPQLAQLQPSSVAGISLSRETTANIQTSGRDLSRDNVQSVNVRTYADRVQRVENVYAELQRAMYEAREFTVVSELLGDFDHMLISSLHTDRNAQSGNAIKLDIDMQQVAYAELVQRDVRHLLPKKPKKKQSEPQKLIGKLDEQFGPPPPPPKVSMAKSLFGED